jgi:hypothetical protein
MVITSNKFRNSTSQEIFIYQFEVPANFNQTIFVGFPVNLLTTAGSFTSVSTPSPAVTTTNTFTLSSVVISVYRSTSLGTPKQSLFDTPTIGGSLTTTTYTTSASASGTKTFTTEQFIGSLDAEFQPSREGIVYYYNVYLTATLTINSVWSITLPSNSTAYDFSITANLEGSGANVRTSSVSGAGFTLTFNTTNPATYFYGTGEYTVSPPTLLGTVYGYNIYAINNFYGALIGSLNGSLNGTINTVANSTDANYRVPFISGTGTADVSIYNDGGLSFNPSINTLNITRINSAYVGGVWLIDGTNTGSFNALVPLFTSQPTLADINNQSALTFTRQTTSYATGGSYINPFDNFDKVDIAIVFPNWGIVGFVDSNYQTAGGILINFKNIYDYPVYVNFTDNQMSSCLIYRNDVLQ